MQLPILATVLALAGVGSSLPAGHHALNSRAVDRGITAALIEKIMPLSVSCEGRGDECTTSTVAAPYLHQSMLDYNVNSAVAKAGILALIAYESLEMQYKKNVVNAASGQGTANQQSGTNNVAYATALGYSVTTATVLDLVSDNAFNFGTGAWYYSTACTAPTTDAAADAWFTTYISECVLQGSSPDWKTSQPGRWTYWENAKAAYSLS